MADAGGAELVRVVLQQFPAPVAMARVQAAHVSPTRRHIALCDSRGAVTLQSTGPAAGAAAAAAAFTLIDVAGFAWVGFTDRDTGEAHGAALVAVDAQQTISVLGLTAHPAGGAAGPADAAVADMHEVSSYPGARHSEIPQARLRQVLRRRGIGILRKPWRRMSYLFYLFFLLLADLKLKSLRLLGTFQSHAVFLADDITLLTLAISVRRRRRRRKEIGEVEEAFKV